MSVYRIKYIGTYTRVYIVESVESSRFTLQAQFSEIFEINFSLIV